MENLKLIDGNFSPREAKEILLSLISSKIQFHTVKDFGSEIRTGVPEFKSRDRINDLREAKQKIITLMEEADKQNMEVEIYSTITISYTARKEQAL